MATPPLSLTLRLKALGTSAVALCIALRNKALGITS